MTMTAEDYLREENEILRGQLETAKAGLDAAISKSRWQAVTNAELSAAQRELAAYKHVMDTLRDSPCKYPLWRDAREIVEWIERSVAVRLAAKAGA